MQFENITCPHCGILCDDLSIDVDGLSVKPLNITHPGCVKGFVDASFENNDTHSPIIGGKKASLEDALNKAAELLNASSQALVSGLIADVQTCREAVAMTEKVSGVIDHANGTMMRSNVAVMQRHGKVKTTLAEARNRADNIIIFGSDILNRFPRFLDRILSPKQTLGTKNTNNKLITIIDSKAQLASQEFKQKNINYLRLDAPSLDAIIQSLQQIVQTNMQADDEQDPTTQALIELYNTILNSSYTTVVWNTGLLNTETAEQSVQALSMTLKTLMKTHRCVGLPLGGSKGEITASQVATWQTGVPLPISFTTGVPVHDPLLFNGATMLENNEADCLVWIATYSPDDTPPDTNIPTIVIGHPKMHLNKDTAVFIPIGIPGIDTRGLACRTDSVATLPLQKIRETELPSANDVLLKISGLL